MPEVKMPCANCGGPCWSTDHRAVAAPVQVIQKQIETYGAYGAEAEVLVPYAAVFCSLDCAAAGLAAATASLPLTAAYPASA